jgi:hypothetical protein
LKFTDEEYGVDTRVEEEENMVDEEFLHMH